MNNTDFLAVFKNPLFLLLACLTLCTVFIAGVVVGGKQFETDKVVPPTYEYMDDTLPPDAYPDKSPQPPYPPQESMVPSSNNGCVPAGCSGEICADENSSNTVISTCELQPEYVCYQQYGKCERNKYGDCAWTTNTEFEQCYQKETGRIYLENPQALY